MQKGLWKKGLVIGIIMLLVGGGVIPSMGGTVLEMTSSTTIGYPGYIQDLIDNASDGDTINIPSGTYYENIIIDKSISLIGEDKNATIIDGGGSGDVVFVSADWVNISGFTINNSGSILNDSGIDIRSANNTIKKNIIINNKLGVSLGWTNIDNNKVLNNTIKSNSHYGIQAIPYPLSVPCKNLSIIGNKITYNVYAGIWMSTCEFCNISNNILSNNLEGLNMQWHSNDSLISNNIITDNQNYGFWLVYSHRCIVKNNYFKGNGWDGLRVYQHEEDEESSNHSIYHNNIIDEVYEEGSSFWDYGYPSGGNYWYDYSGDDNYRGPNQDIPGSDGIGDTKKYKDSYPLIDLWGEQRPVADFSFIVDNYTVHFNASSSYDRDGIVLIFNWDFGDHTTGMGMNISHTYESNGTYSVKLIVIDDDGDLGEFYQFVRVNNKAPYTPSNPEPPDNDTEVDVNINLSWNCSDPEGDDLTYDVYFGNTTSPQKVKSNQTNTTYKPGLLNFNTTFFWKIIAWDEYGASTEGEIWSFTTEENLPPNEPCDPDPPDGATDVSIGKILKWTGGDPNPGDKVTYDMYFGTSSPPPLDAEDLLQTVYDPFGSGSMELGTVYYWQVVSKDSQGLTATGPIWHFTTELEPNSPPTKPEIYGSSRGTAGKELSWAFESDDPEDNQVKYLIDWGDETSEETDYHPDSTPVDVYHTYEERGEYNITAYAEDEKGLVSEESTFSVVIPRPRIAYHSLLVWFLNRFPLLEKLLSLIWSNF